MKQSGLYNLPKFDARMESRVFGDKSANTVLGI